MRVDDAHDGLLTGTGFGDNLRAALPDVIGQTVGGVVAAEIARSRGAGTGTGGAATASDGAQGSANGSSGTAGVDAQPGDVVVTGNRRSLTPASEVAYNARAVQDRNDIAKEDAAGASTPTVGRAIRVANRISLTDHNSDYQQFKTEQARTGWISGDDAIEAGFTAQKLRILGLNEYATDLVDRPIMSGLSDVVTAAITTALAPANIAYTAYQFGTGQIDSAEATMSILPGARAGSIAGRSTISAARGVERSIAAQNILQARGLLRETGLPLTERNQIIRSFDLQTFRVETVGSDMTALRLFDDSNAVLRGRYVSNDFLASQTDRIQSFSLMKNSATRLGEVTIPRGATVFTGRVAPQAAYSPGLTGGANQTFLTGNLNNYTFREIYMPR